MKTKCRHYLGPIHNANCAAGVNYRKLADDSKPGYLVRLPCVIGSPLTKNPVECEKLSLLTKEELDKIEQEITSNGILIVKAISEIRKTKKDFGDIPCPSCAGKLSFSIAKLNGHIWGKCSKSGCLSWMS